jgi:hypothetical protein
VTGPRRDLRRANIDELWDAVFSVTSAPRLYYEDQWDKPVKLRVLSIKSVVWRQTCQRSWQIVACRGGMGGGGPPLL